MVRVVTGLILVAVAIVGLNQSQPSQAAAPRDGVYDIAVLNVGSSWNDEEFQSLNESPGIFDFDWEVIQPEDLASDIDDFDVLIVPYSHDYDWLEDEMLDAIVDFVRAGGTLIIHSPNRNIDDAILAGFGATYEIVWIQKNADQVRIISANHPLVTTPNKLSNSGLSNWGQSYHSFVLDTGKAWKWAADSPDGLILACAPFGEGSIVISGLDPESHLAPDRDANDVIENEITINRGGICEGRGDDDDEDEEDERRPPALGGLAGALTSVDTAQQNRERAAAAGRAAAAAAQTAPPAAAVRPPSTGDAGLADANGDSPMAPWIALVAATGIFGVGALWAARRRSWEK